MLRGLVGCVKKLVCKGPALWKNMVQGLLESGAVECTGLGVLRLFLSLFGV